MEERVINELRALQQPSELLKRLIDEAYDCRRNTIEIEFEADVVEVYFTDAKSGGAGLALDADPGLRLISHILERTNFEGENGVLTLTRQGTLCAIRVVVRHYQKWNLQSRSNIGIECQLNLHLPEG